MKLQRIEPENARGLLDKFLGLGKEVVGTIFDRNALREEGEAQQKKGGDRLRALRNRIEAEANDVKAKVHDTQQRAAQKVKESV